MMYYANMQAENQRKTGYIIGKNASSDSRHLLKKSRKRYRFSVSGFCCVSIKTTGYER